MNKSEFKAIVDDAVANGAKREDAEAYVRAGYKIDDRAFADGKSPVRSRKAKKAKK